MAVEAANIIPISIFGKQKGLISEEIKPFIMCLVEIREIEPLTLTKGYYFRRAVCFFITFSAILMAKTATGIVRISMITRTGLLRITAAIVSAYPAGISSTASARDSAVFVHQWAE